MPTPKRFVRRALSRHWRLAGMVAVSVLLLTLLGIMYQPQEYCSEARLLVPRSETEINALRELLKSRVTFDRLAESLGPDYVLTGHGEPNPFQTAAANTPATPSAAHQQAAAHLQKSVEVERLPTSNVLSIQCQASTPAQAQKITARLAEISLDIRPSVQPTAESQLVIATIAEQAQLSQSEWQSAVDRLNRERDKLGIAPSDGNRRRIQDEIAALDVRLLTNQTELKASQKRLATLEQSLAAIPETLPTQETEVPDAAPDNLRETILQLEAREQELASTRGDDHPQLLAVRQQLADLHKSLREPAAQRTVVTQAANPARRTTELDLQREQSQAAALREREQALTDQLAALRKDLSQLDSQHAALSQLQQQADQAEAQHKSLAEELEQVRLRSTHDAQPLASLTLDQPATLPTEPLGPPRAYVLALGAILACWCGLGTALLAAFCRPVLGSRLALERLWDLPIVGVLPRVEPRMAAAS